MTILIPTCASSCQTFLMMYSAYKLNKQVPFPIWNQPFVPCPVLTIASWPTYRFHRMQARWSGILISWRIFQFVVIHTVKGFGIVNKIEVNVFLDLLCIFSDRTDVGNLTSGSSVFSKFSLDIWKFTVHGPQPCLTQWNYEPCHVGPPKTDGSWSRFLTKQGPLEKGMANHFSILALRTPWTVWKGKKIGHWKMNSPGR